MTSSPEGQKKIKLLYAGLAMAVLTLVTCNPLPPIDYEFTPPPVEWVPERDRKHGSLLFKRDDPPMGIMVGTECERYQNVPLDPLSRNLFIGFKDRKELHRGEAMVDGHDAVEVVMECSLDDVPLKVKSYTLKAGGCIYDLVYFSTPEEYDTGLGVFEDFVGAFEAREK